ncbi:MAG TPA: DUF3343 domain-containing protein [Firmicutes bacterium]|nr:DUF3343 domain-containing protein [Bacillota bacterium]
MSENKVVVTFRTTTEAMAWERVCKNEGLPGRLIPMPVQISAECGLVWLIHAREQERLMERATELGLKCDKVIQLV